MASAPSPSCIGGTAIPALHQCRIAGQASLYRRGRRANPQLHGAVVSWRGGQQAKYWGAVSQCSVLECSVLGLHLLTEPTANYWQGVCRTDGGCVVFVERALPGEAVEARVVQHKKSEPLRGPSCTRVVSFAWQAAWIVFLAGHLAGRLYVANAKFRLLGRLCCVETLAARGMSSGVVSVKGLANGLPTCRQHGLPLGAPPTLTLAAHSTN